MAPRLRFVLEYCCSCLQTTTSGRFLSVLCARQTFTMQTDNIVFCLDHAARKSFQPYRTSLPTPSERHPLPLRHLISSRGFDCSSVAGILPIFSYLTISSLINYALRARIIKGALDNMNRRPRVHDSCKIHWAGPCDEERGKKASANKWQRKKKQVLIKDIPEGATAKSNN